MTTHEKSVPACPRCGYDQSGIIATWENAGACPLEGTCSECGLSIRWRDLLNPQWAVPRWSFEHRAGWWQVGAHLRTCWAALRPWSFWTGMNLHFPIVRSRLLRHAAAMLLASHLMIALTSAWYAQATVSGWILTSPGAYRPPRPEEWAALRVGAALEAFVWPYGSVRLWTPRGFWTHRLAVPKSVMYMQLWLLLTPGAFFVLTESLRRVPVRSRHLLRGLSYGLTTLPIVTLAALFVNGTLGAYIVGSSMAILRWPFEERVPWLLVGAIAIWQFLHWSRFAGKYLGLSHPAGVAAAMILVGGLAAAVLVVLWWIAEMGGAV